ncbi:MAG: hypothetical protein H6581_17835 [Bacteroidia bacterium]|nr:hypothetical protein [Bacteroidia bacterium]
MSKFSLFLYYNKIQIFNWILGLYIFLVPPEVFNSFGDNEDFHFYLGLSLILAFFLEYSGIWYKTHFIYSRRVAMTGKVPIWLKLSFLPRIAVSGGLGLLAFAGLGWLNSTDFTLVVVVIYAVLKEFWVRSTLMNPESTEGAKISPARVWLGEIFIFLYIAVGYLCVWEFYLLEEGRILSHMAYLHNLPVFGLLFLVALSVMFVPYLVEEYFRGKRNRFWVIISFLLPMAAFMFHVYRIGKKIPFFW